MGKHRSRRGNADQNQTRRNETDQIKRELNGNPWKTFSKDDMGNARFEEYYRTQGIIGEDEWPAFLDRLKTGLPTTFRVTGSREHAEAINEVIKDKYVPTMQDTEWEGTKYDPPEQIPWYPGGLAWQLSAPKRVVRKTEPFKVFQRFLVGETEVGNLSRQEAVSMIPPLFLDVRPHHVCLDMCAAPGSKTAQIIEALNPHHTSSTGLLIANDSDNKRTHMLVHQTGRMPSKSIMVTNLDATLIPKISVGTGKDLRFDRILADVPCSGDGTLRKNIEIWKKWTVADGNSLHALQLRILTRAMALSKPGGRIVYSTCSFNPAENEAVIAAALNAHPGRFTIADVSASYPELKRRPGMTSWKVGTPSPVDGRQMSFHASHAAYQSADAGSSRETGRKELASSLWPPANVTELALDRCLRLIPQDQDTGGFFVCVLDNTSSASNGIGEAVPDPEPVRDNEVPEDPTIADERGSILESGLSNPKREREPSSSGGAAGLASKKPRSDGNNTAIPTPVDEIEASSSSSKTAVPPAKSAQQPKKKSKPDLSFKEDPYSFVAEDNAEVAIIRKWFQLKDDFPRRNLMVRNEYGDPVRTMYITNDLVKTILQSNDYSRLRVVSAGVKAFTRQDSQKNTAANGCRWRIPADGLLEILPFVGESQVQSMTLKELRLLLEEQYPPIELFDQPVRDWLNKMEVGNVLVKFEAGDLAGGSLPLPLLQPVWRAKTSLSLLIDKREKSVLSLRTFGEDIVKPMTAQIERKPINELSSVHADEEGDRAGDRDGLQKGEDGGGEVDVGVGRVKGEATLEEEEMNA